MGQYPLPFGIDAATRLAFFLNSMGVTVPPKVRREAEEICQPDRVTRK